jgi:uncharacterized MAPEG superfamily protein
MTVELHYLVLVTVLTAILWVPYVLNRLAVRGIPDTVGYPENPRPQAAWAARLQKAHGNAVENLVVFATLVLAAHAAGLSNEQTVFAAQLYFWGRLVHAIAYTLAWPWVRTLAFTAGFVAQAIFAWQLLG